ncbi:MAG: DCC1-like thiol-disulfide oxidoreductase family protein [Nitrospinota bacterium]|nr:DCC1-like thiol-disulfide oxidoreductase family protein [Nitrospinota bacterium]
MNPDPSNHILLFDGVCNLCNGLVQFVIGRDPESKFSFASLQSETGSKLLHKYGLPTDDMDTFVYIRNGIAYKKSTAGLFTLKDLGGVWSIAFMLVFIPTLIRDFFYDLLATHRHGIFGKKNTCMIPSSETKDRFLD